MLIPREGSLLLAASGSLRIVCEPTAVNLVWNLIFGINHQTCGPAIHNGGTTVTVYTRRHPALGSRRAISRTDPPTTSPGRVYRYAFIALSAATLSIVIGIACSTK